MLWLFMGVGRKTIASYPYTDFVCLRYGHKKKSRTQNSIFTTFSQKQPNKKMGNGKKKNKKTTTTLHTRHAFRFTPHTYTRSSLYI